MGNGFQQWQQECEGQAIEGKVNVNGNLQNEKCLIRSLAQMIKDRLSGQQFPYNNDVITAVKKMGGFHWCIVYDSDM